MKQLGFDGFEELVRENQRIVFQIAFGVLGNAADAQDVAQDAFVRAYAKRSTLREPERFRSWVYTITRRLALNRLRSDARTRKREERVAHGAAPGVDIAAIAEQNELHARVRNEIDRLPDKLRDVVLLCAVDGLEPSAVATLLGIPAGTVRSRLHLARKQLVRALS